MEIYFFKLKPPAFFFFLFAKANYKTFALPFIKKKKKKRKYENKLDMPVEG